MIARTSRLATATAVFLALLAAPALAAPGDPGSAELTQTQETDPTAPPEQVLPRDMRGEAAVDALGEDLPEVAEQNDLTVPGLTDLLVDDRSAWIDQAGQLYYRETMPAAELGSIAGIEPPSLPDELPSLDIAPGATEGGSAAMAGTPATPAYATTQTFKLHSRPSATRVIFLDFDGGEVAGTGWNTGRAPIGNGLYTGYDADGRPGTFSSTEHAWMQEVWRQVAETYAPFDVDVTTEDKGTASRIRTSNADVNYGTQVLFTNSTQAVAQACNSSCLGIAWVGTFSDIDPAGYYQPAWIFTRTTTSATIAAQGASHEAGHTLGLHHDGLGSAAVLQGHPGVGPDHGLGVLASGQPVQQGRVHRREPGRGRLHRDQVERASPPCGRPRQHRPDRRGARRADVVRRERGDRQWERHRRRRDQPASARPISS